MLADFFRFVGNVIMIIALIVMLLLAAPKMWEQATSDKSNHPHSGATPDCPSWNVSLEEGMERTEAIRSYHLGK